MDPNPSADRRAPIADPSWLFWQLADSAFPTGGFAHSWGLEAAWQSGEVADVSALRHLLRDVAWQTGRGALPFLTAAFRRPERLDELDLLNDVFLTNAVANRASRVQGRAFASTCARIWPSAAFVALDARKLQCCGHGAPTLGAALRALDVPLDTSQRLVLFGATRGVLAAAVRLGIVGSYQAQRLQFESGPLLDAVLRTCGDLEDEDAAQTAPILDLLQATHDRLYSRLFQS
jgi:urease accessory protein